MSRLLKKLEKKIEANEKNAWYENDLILLKIKNESLYLKNHKTFDSYLQDRWNIGIRRGQQKMKSAKFMIIAARKAEDDANQNGELVRVTDVVLPRTESQVRPLIEKLNHNGERLHVWDDVVKKKT